jgi:hypothetical protein
VSSKCETPPKPDRRPEARPDRKPDQHRKATRREAKAVDRHFVTPSVSVTRPNGISSLPAHTLNRSNILHRLIIIPAPRYHTNNISNPLEPNTVIRLERTAGHSLSSIFGQQTNTASVRSVKIACKYSSHATDVGNSDIPGTGKSVPLVSE